MSSRTGTSGGQIAKMGHRVADPVAVAGVPEETAEIAEEESSTRGAGRGEPRGSGGERIAQSRGHESEPGEDGAPGR